MYVSERVELTATGEQRQLDLLCDWLWQGSPGSNVTAVDTEQIAFVTFDGFEIRY